MKIFDHPAQSQWAELCARTRKDDPQVAARVDAILERVRTEGDAALQALSLEIDRRPLAVQPGQEGLPLEVPVSDIAAAAARVRPEVRAAIATAAGHIRAFHEAQLPREIVVETAPGVRCIQRPVPRLSGGDPVYAGRSGRQHRPGSAVRRLVLRHPAHFLPGRRPGCRGNGLRYADRPQGR